MDQKGRLDQEFLSIIFLHSWGLLAACQNRWVKRCVIASLLIVRLARESEMKNGTFLEGVA